MSQPWENQSTPTCDSLLDHVANLHNDWVCADHGAAILALPQEDARNLERRMRAAEALLEIALMLIPFGQFAEQDQMIRAHLIAARKADTTCKKCLAKRKEIEQ